MKKCLIIIILIFSLTTNGYCFQNEPNGFFNMKWSSPVSELKKMYNSVRLLKDGDIQWYVPNSGFVKFSGAMTRVTYQYLKGELFFVNIYFEKEDINTLKNALKISYGEPTKSADGIFFWEGEVTSISLDSKNSLISFWSTKIMSRSKKSK